MDTHFNYRTQYNDSAYEKMPPMHFIDNERDDALIDEPNMYKNYAVEAITYNGPDPILFEEDAPRRNAGKVSGILNTRYNGHRGYGEPDPVHPELFMDFDPSRKQWQEPNGVAGTPDMSKLANQAQYRMRYQRLHSDADHSTPESGVWEHQLQEKRASAAWSAVRQMKVFDRQLESWIRGAFHHKTPGAERNLVSKIPDGDFRASKEHRARMAAIMGDPHAIRESKNLFAKNSDYNLGYSAEEIRGAMPRFDHDPQASLHANSQQMISFDDSKSVSAAKRSMNREISGMKRVLSKYDSDLNDSEQGIIRKAINLGSTFLNKLSGNTANVAADEFADSRASMTLKNYRDTLNNIQGSAVLGNLAAAEGFNNRETANSARRHKSAPSPYDAALRDLTRLEKLQDSAHEHLARRPGKRDANKLRERMMSVVTTKMDEQKEDYRGRAVPAHDGNAAKNLKWSSIPEWDFGEQKTHGTRRHAQVHDMHHQNNPTIIETFNGSSAIDDNSGGRGHYSQRPNNSSFKMMDRAGMNLDDEI